VALTADDRVVLAGYAEAGGSSTTLARYTADGSPDPTFGTGGQTAVPFTVYDLAIAADGRIVAAAGTVARFTADGALDPTFAASPGTATPSCRSRPSRRTAPARTWSSSRTARW
jgi:uncharacterized delta-60 repeat protein